MAGLAARIRFLPVTIFAASMLLTVKVSDIVDGFSVWYDLPIQVAGAGAQQKPEAEEQSAAARAAAAGEPAEGAAQTETADTRTAPAPEMDTGEDESAERMFVDDPTLLTQSEIDLLQQLAERRDELDVREREIGQRTGLLNAAETRIDKKVAELKVLQGTIEGLIKTHKTQRDNQMASLVKIYQNMKPKDAARIFEELDMDILLMVAEGMKERSLAPIMATMNPAKAKDMTVELARLRKLPLPGTSSGG